MHKWTIRLQEAGLQESTPKLLKSYTTFENFEKMCQSLYVYRFYSGYLRYFRVDQKTRFKAKEIKTTTAAPSNGNKGDAAQNLQLLVKKYNDQINALVSGRSFHLIRE